MHDTDPMTFEHDVSITSSTAPNNEVREGVSKGLLPALADIFTDFRIELEKSNLQIILYFFFVKTLRVYSK